jgi:hypothetical protein
VNGHTYVSRVPILTLSTIFQMDVEAVLTVWYVVSHFIFSIKLYTTYTCFVVGSVLFFVLVFCVVLCFVVLLVFVLCLVCPKMPVPLDCPFLISTSVFYNVYCRARLLLFTIEYFILLQTLVPLIAWQSYFTIVHVCRKTLKGPHLA